MTRSIRRTTVLAIAGVLAITAASSRDRAH